MANLVTLLIFVVSFFGWYFAGFDEETLLEHMPFLCMRFIKEFPWIEVVVLTCGARIVASIGARRLLSQIRGGMQLGTAQGQILEIVPVRKDGAKPEDPPSTLFKITWRGLQILSGNDFVNACGGEILAQNLADAAKAAVLNLLTPIVRLTGVMQLHALCNLEANITASMQGHSGEMREFLVVSAVEDSARIIRTRFFYIPPAMLLLFYGKLFPNGTVEDYLCFSTAHPYQNARAAALAAIAQQVIGNANGLDSVPEFSNFKSGYVVGLRRIPVNIAEGDVNWWDSRWAIDLREPLTSHEIDARRTALHECLDDLATAGNLGHVVGLQHSFTAVFKAYEAGESQRPMLN